MLAQGVRNLMTDHCGQLVVRRLHLVEQAGIDGNLAARHAPGVYVLGGQHIHLPAPVRRIGAKNTSRHNQAI